MGTISVGLLSAPAALAAGSNSPSGVWGGVTVDGHPQSLSHPRPVRMAELLPRRHHATASGQPPANRFAFPLWPFSVSPPCQLEPKCRLLHHSATPEWSGLFWKPAGGSNRNNPTSTKTGCVSSLQIPPNIMYPLHRLSSCRVTGLNPVLRTLGATLQLLGPQ